MDSAVIGGIVRTILATFGGILVSKGVLDDGTLQAIIGGVITVGTGVWSVIQKRKAEQK